MVVRHRGNVHSAPSYCAARTTEHAVRCCSDVGITGFALSDCRGKQLWSESENKGFGGCQRSLQFGAAQTLCTSMGARLCTHAELSAGCAVGTGCGLDSMLVWSSTSGQGMCVRRLGSSLRLCVSHRVSRRVSLCVSLVRVRSLSPSLL